MNEFYINIAKNIGINSTSKVNDDHPSIKKIKEQNFNQNFEFETITEKQVSTCIKKLNPKKATGVDAIPPNIIKAAMPSLILPICNIVNTMLSKETFPSQLKMAQVTPIFKKDDPFIPKNYRPVSILPTLSKIYERLLGNQLTSHFNEIFHSYLSAFRTSYGCQTTLLRIVEDWKEALDKNMFVGAILMDLSKAFDCLPHDLIIKKLNAYGVSDSSCRLMASYLSNRTQRVKIGSVVSSWAEIMKGVPQGSILGPLIFNIFINDIFYFITQCKLYNYADDNTVSYWHREINTLKRILEKEGLTLIDWFDSNHMQANPDKFQAVAVGIKTFDKVKQFTLAGTDIPCEKNVKLLGVELDFMLNFDNQIKTMCMKAARQLNVLRRLSKFLSEDTRLLIFKSFIQSNFNYCPLIWHFCSKANAEKLEKLQYRALRIVFNDYVSSYESLLNKVKLPTLHMSRLRCIATETYKCINNMTPEYLKDLVEVKQSNYSFRYENTVKIPTVRTVTYGQRSFRFESARVWNSLPNEYRTAMSFREFKGLIRTWVGPRCNCAMCGS